MLKVNLQTNRIITLLAVLQILLLVCLSGLSFIHPLPRHHMLSISLWSVVGLLALIFIGYMLRILAFVGEKQFIKIAFVFYAGLYVIRVLSGFFPVIGLPEVYNVSLMLLGLLTFFSEVFLFVACLCIKNKTIFNAYLLYSAVILAILIAEVAVSLLGPILFRSRWEREPFGYVHFSRSIINVIELLSLLIPVAVIMLTKSVSKLLKGEVKEFLYYRPQNGSQQ